MPYGIRELELVEVHSVGVASAVLLGETSQARVQYPAVEVDLAGVGVESFALEEDDGGVAAGLALLEGAVAVEVGDFAIGVVDVALDRDTAVAGGVAEGCDVVIGVGDGVEAFFQAAGAGGGVAVGVAVALDQLIDINWTPDVLVLR